MLDNTKFDEELRAGEAAFLQEIFEHAECILPDFDFTVDLHRRPRMFAPGMTAVYVPYRGRLYEFPFDLEAVPEVKWSEPVRRVRFTGGARELFAERCDTFAILAPEDDPTY